MRYICIVAILIALPVTSVAQTRGGAGARQAAAAPSEPRPEERPKDQARRGEQRQNHQRQADQRQNNQQAVEQRPSSGLSPIGLPPPPPAQPLPWWERQQAPAWERRQIPAWEQKQSPSWERPQLDPWLTMNPARALLDQGRDDRRLAKTPRPDHGLPGHGRPPIYYPLPPYRYFPIYTTYGYGYTESTTTTQVTPPPPEPETGFLRLEVEPHQSVQVFIDGLYFGTLMDLGNELELNLGPRRIELRAPGYRTLVFDTRIEFDHTVVYRGWLERLEDAPAPPQAPQAPQAPGSRIMYLIPGCYLGNVQPTASMLRPGCDIGKLTISAPQ